MGSIKSDIPEGVQLQDEPFCLTGNWQVNFNPCFTCVIGGRGSGKSTLLQMLARSYGAAVESTAVENTLSALSKDGTSFDPMECIETVGTAASAEVEYIHQNAVEGFAQDASRLKSAIDNRVKKRVEIDQYEGLLGNLKTAHDDIAARIQNLEEAGRITGERDRAKTELREKKALIEAVSDDSYQTEQKRLAEAQRTKRRLTWAVDGIDSVVSGLREHKNTLKEIAEWPEIPYANRARDASEVIDRVVESLADEEARKDANDAVTHWSREEEKAQTSIREIFKARGLDPESVTDVEAATAQVGPLEERLKELDQWLAALHEKGGVEQSASLAADELEGYLDGVVAAMAADLASTSEQVDDLSVTAERNRSRARSDWIDWCIERVRRKEEKGRIQEAKIKEILESLPLRDELEWRDLEACLKGASAQQAARQIRNALEGSFDFRVAQLEWGRRQTDVEKYRTYRLVYSGREIDNLSFGQRCTAVLIFLLQMGNAPVIIDEPEAHLDSLLIARYLVKMIKARKQKRQIIFATHNANFVINGDADLVHHLRINDEGQTEIYSFAIEDLEGREKLLGLEGGDQAFRARAIRYQGYSGSE